MAAPVPTRVPERFTSGDTLLFDIGLEDYPPGTWTLSYAFQQIEPDFAEIDFSASTQGGGFRVNVPATTTVLWPSGTYNGQAYVTSATGERHQVWAGLLEILPNDALNQQVDIRSNNRRTRDALRGCLLKLASKQVAKATIEGVQMEFRSLGEVEKLISLYEARVMAEERRNSGKQRSVILSRFTLPC